MWHRFNPNPRGSSVGDCVVRAVAAATGQSFVEAASAVPFSGLMEVLDRHMSAIKIAYPKEYELVMKKIRNL